MTLDDRICALLTDLAGVDTFETNLRDQPAAYAAVEKFLADQHPIPNIVTGVDGSRFLQIELGHGKVEMGYAIHDRRLPALWFGNDGQGMGFDRHRGDFAKPGETIAVVTFANVEGLDVMLHALRDVRRKAFPDAGPEAA